MVLFIEPWTSDSIDVYWDIDKCLTSFPWIYLRLNHRNLTGEWWSCFIRKFVIVEIYIVGLCIARWIEWGIHPIDKYRFCWQNVHWGRPSLTSLRFCRFSVFYRTCSMLYQMERWCSSLQMNENFVLLLLLDVISVLSNSRLPPSTAAMLDCVQMKTLYLHLFIPGCGLFLTDRILLKIQRFSLSMGFSRENQIWTIW